MTRSRIALSLLVLPGGTTLAMALAGGGLRMLDGSTSVGGDPAAAVTGLAAVLAAAIAAWLTLCLALAVAAELPGAAGAAARALRDRITPVVVQRWAAVVLGASVTASVVPGTAVAAVRASVDPSPVAGPTGGTSGPSPGWVTGASPTTLPSPGFTPSTGRPPSTERAGTPSPGWLPTRPSLRHRGDPHLLTGRQRAGTAEQSVVVRRGDTLWSIAAAHLGPEATDAEIAQAWHRWHEANAATIGTDPHTLLPGTQLAPPPAH